MKTTKLVIVDDHRMIRDGLSAILKGNSHVQVLGDFGSGEELMHFLEQEEVDFILLDMHLPLKNGIEISRDVKSKFPKIKILINTMSELIEEMEQAVDAGVNGYILKTSGSDELFKAIDTITNGGSYFGASVINSFVKSTGATRYKNNLTPAELKIIQLLYLEKNQVTMAAELNIAKGTVANHLKNIYRKLHIKTEVGLIKFALKNNLIEKN